MIKGGPEGANISNNMAFQASAVDGQVSKTGGVLVPRVAGDNLGKQDSVISSGTFTPANLADMLMARHASGARSNPTPRVLIQRSASIRDPQPILEQTDARTGRWRKGRQRRGDQSHEEPTSAAEFRIQRQRIATADDIIDSLGILDDAGAGDQPPNLPPTGEPPAESPTPKRSILEINQEYTETISKRAKELKEIAILREVHQTSELGMESVRIQIAGMVFPAAAALAIESETSKMSQTDVINRALQMYGLSSAIIREGHEHQLQDGANLKTYDFNDATRQPPEGPLGEALREYQTSLQERMEGIREMTKLTQIGESFEGMEYARLLSVPLLYSAIAALSLEKQANNGISSTDIINAAILEYCLSMVLARAGHDPIHHDILNGSNARLYRFTQ